MVEENEVTESVNAIDNDSGNSKECFGEDFRTFKKSLFAQVNVFKYKLLTSYAPYNVKLKSNVNKLNNSDRLLYGPILWMGFNCIKATEPLRGGSLLFTTKFPEIRRTHLITTGRMKG